jgi:hypothetical protein
MDQDDDKTFMATIHTLVRQFHSAATPENILGSFVRALFSHKTRSAPYVLDLSKERIMESAGFRQGWELGLALESRSMHGQNAQFGFANEESFQPFDETESAFNRGIVRKYCIMVLCIFTFSPYMMQHWDHISNTETI